MKLWQYVDHIAMKGIFVAILHFIATKDIYWNLYSERIWRTAKTLPCNFCDAHGKDVVAVIVTVRRRTTKSLPCKLSHDNVLLFRSEQRQSVGFDVHHMSASIADMLALDLWTLVVLYDRLVSVPAMVLDFWF
jgi:hypothetical protein